MSLRGVFSCPLQQPSFSKTTLSGSLQTRAGRGHESAPREQGGLLAGCHPQGGQGDLESSETDENERGQGRRPKVLEEARGKGSRHQGSSVTPRPAACLGTRGSSWQSERCSTPHRERGRGHRT